MSTSLPQVIIDPDGDAIITVSLQKSRFEGSEDEIEPGSSTSSENIGCANSIETTRSSETQDVKAQTVDPKTSPDEKSGTCFKVSMKHLTMASNRAKALFAGEEAAKPQLDGLHHWNYHGASDPLAFEIVMNAIHGKTRKLPKTLTVATLAEVATIVQELDCQQVLWFPAKIWIDQLRGSVLAVVYFDLLRLLFISYVFEESELFEKATQVVLAEMKEPLSSRGLPFPPNIINMINEERERLLKALTGQLGALLELISSQRACSYDCKSLILGTLTHDLLSANRGFFRRSSAFEGLSLTAVTTMIRKFQLPQLYRPYTSEAGRVFVRNVWVVKKAATLPSERSDSGSQGEGTPPQICEGSGYRLAEHICSLRRLVVSEMEGLSNLVVKGLELPKC